jgi:hypothetical protein
MAIINIGSRPDLTPDQAREVFAQHFAGKYEVVTSNALNRQFIIRKSGWAGVGVRLKQEKTGTSFVFTGLIPNVALQVMFGGAIAYLFLRSSWKELEAEIAQFIENEPSFQQETKVEELAA